MQPCGDQFVPGRGVAGTDEPVEFQHGTISVVQEVLRDVLAEGGRVEVEDVRADRRRSAG